MRMFFAVEFPPEVRRALSDAAAPLRAVLPEARFTRSELIHLTLYFVGEQTPSQADALARLLRGLDATGPFTLRTGALGSFRSGRGHTLWIGLEPHPALDALRDELLRRLLSAGYPPAEARFTPHVTLAREAPADGLMRIPAAPLPIDIPVGSATLFESLRRDGRLIYRPHAVRLL